MIEWNDGDDGVMYQRAAVRYAGGCLVCKRGSYGGIGTSLPTTRENITADQIVREAIRCDVLTNVQPIVSYHKGIPVMKKQNKNAYSFPCPNFLPSPP